jgi:regulator of RNase E activity RraA
MVSRELLEKLRSFDTPTICNLIELFEVRPRSSGYMDARIRACFPDMPPVVGFAATATFRAAAPPGEGDAYAGLEAQVERFGELSGPAVVVFQDLDDPPVGATFGEVMCSIYQAFGAAGLITSGAGRDLDQVRSINFPVFTSATIPSHGDNHIPQLHVPVRVGGVMVAANDLLHGDVNGVTTIPFDIAAELADVGAEFVAAEAIVLEALRREAPSAALLREARGESKARMAELRSQVSRATLK